MTSDLAGLPIDDLIDAALGNTAAGEHLDVRVMSTRTAHQTQRDRQAVADVDQLDVAVGVRALVDGCWGFAATSDLDPDAVARVAREAVELAAISAPTVNERVELAAEATQRGEWTSAYDVDPFDVAPSQRRGVLAERCERLLDAGLQHAAGEVMAVREETVFADLRGSRTRQRRVRVQADWTGIRTHRKGSFDTLRTTAPPAGRGWEYILGEGDSVRGARRWDWDDEIDRLPGRLAEKATAPSVEPGPLTVVLDPTNLWLTIHESVGHATELDRVRGHEANYAGTSFATEDKLGSYRYGSDLMNVTGDRTAIHGLSTVAWDDEGVPAQRWDLIRDGVLVAYQLDRSMARERSNGCAYADSALHVPLQRMPNVSLEPDPQGGSVADLIAGVEDGIYIIGDNSWSIDMQRYNFQFTGQRFERIRNGELVGQVKDIAYQGSTPQFWGSLTALGGPDTYLLAGAFNCGKGQPGQVAPVSHGCPAARFDNVNILSTSAEAGS